MALCRLVCHSTARKLYKILIMTRPIGVDTDFFTKFLFSCWQKSVISFFHTFMSLNFPSVYAFNKHLLTLISGFLPSMCVLSFYLSLLLNFLWILSGFPCMFFILNVCFVIFYVHSSRFISLYISFSANMEKCRFYIVWLYFFLYLVFRLFPRAAAL